MDLPKTFTIYLKTKGVSKITVKNYLSDLNHFLAWLELKLKTLNLPFSLHDQNLFFLYFTEEVVKNYRNFLSVNRIPSSTINRRLATLRAFSRFCLIQGFIKNDPLEKISNFPKPKKIVPENFLRQFAEALKEEGKSKVTIKNYLVDIRQFLNWMVLEEKF